MKAILADLHTHTLASQHAFSTLRENITCAQQHNLDYLAVTDHLFYSDDRITRLNELSRITDVSQFKNIPSTRIIGGVETNLNHAIACKDIEKIETAVPWRLVGFHSGFLSSDPSRLAPSELPKQFEYSIISNGRIKPTAFAHIERGLEAICKAYGADQVLKALGDIVDIALEYDMYLEINNSSISRNAMTRDFMRHWITYAKEKKAKFCLGTDAHYCDLVGDFRNTIEFLSELNMDNAYILNCDAQALEALFRANGGVRINAEATNQFTTR